MQYDDVGQGGGVKRGGGGGGGGEGAGKEVGNCICIPQQEQ